jgi:hypothetical protein
VADSTFDMLRRCPKCGELGLPSGSQSQGRSTLHFFTCQNPACRWFQGAPWIRQRNPDGTWVEEQTHDKFFPDIPDRTTEVQESIDRDIARQTGRTI